ncbi:MAG: SpoVA/SpoVAEb family sporulation membrane protein, partial [Clostridia bacterium]|nr:SpoVA/SpoVAEb family sporulation membrane protein [Clostridia bacterium]
MNKNKIMSKEEYGEYIKQFMPKTNEKRSLFHSFIVGGFICSIGQFIRFFFSLVYKLEGDTLASATSVVLIFLGVLLTGLGVYDRIGKRAGGGSIVPITGFANSVASPAMEFAREGFIYGMAAKMFIVAGPIIVFGVSGS